MPKGKCSLKSPLTFTLLWARVGRKDSMLPPAPRVSPIRASGQYIINSLLHRSGPSTIFWRGGRWEKLRGVNTLCKWPLQPTFESWESVNLVPPSYWWSRHRLVDSCQVPLMVFPHAHWFKVNKLNANFCSFLFLEVSMVESDTGRTVHLQLHTVFNLIVRTFNDGDHNSSFRRFPFWSL